MKAGGGNLRLFSFRAVRADTGAQSTSIVHRSGDLAKGRYAMWSFYWPIIRRVPIDFWKAVHQTHSLIFLIVDIFLVAVGVTLERKDWWLAGLALLLAYLIFNLLVSIYNHHCAILDDTQAAMKAAANSTETTKAKILMMELQALYNERAAMPPIPVGWSESEIAHKKLRSAHVNSEIARLEEEIREQSHSPNGISTAPATRS